MRPKYFSMIGIVSDAHGNTAGVERAVRVLRRAGAAEIFSLGDSVGYIPGAAVVGFQNELRRSCQRLTASCFGIAKCLRAVLRHPYALSALLCSYGVGELMKSALHAHDAGLVAISAAYGVGTLFLSLLDYGLCFRAQS